MRFIIGLLLGLGIGLAAAVLLAPEKGQRRPEGEPLGEEESGLGELGEGHDALAGLQRAMRGLQRPGGGGWWWGRGAGVVYRGGLENRCAPYGVPWVRIPPPPPDISIKNERPGTCHTDPPEAEKDMAFVVARSEILRRFARQNDIVRFSVLCSPRRGAGVVERARLESVCTLWVPWVRIPPPPPDPPIPSSTPSNRALEALEHLELLLYCSNAPLVNCSTSQQPLL